MVLRSLALVFSVVAARVLEPSGFGAMMYGLTVATVASTFIVNATYGLPRFLSPRADAEQHDSYFTNFVVMVLIALLLSSLAMIATSQLAGLQGWMVVGVLANFLGLAAISVYKALYAAKDRTGRIVVCLVVANGLQLLAVLGLAAMHWTSPALYLTVYGLSSVAGIAVMELASATGYRFVIPLISWSRIKEIGRFAAPIMLQAIFFPIWMGADILLLQHLGQETTVGDYAVAKTLASALYSAPAAMAMVVMPRAVSAGRRETRRLVGVTLGLTAGLTLPALLVLIVASDLIVGALFGERFLPATAPLPILAVGMTLHGFYVVLESIWVGLGRTRVVAVTMALAMITTVGLCLWLIPHYGVIGAALAFTMGGVVQLIVIGLPTLWMMRPRGTPSQAMVPIPAGVEIEEDLRPVPEPASGQLRP